MFIKQPGCELCVDRNPFVLQVTRAGRVILEVQRDAVAQDVQFEQAILRVTFVDSTLDLSLAPDRLKLVWHGENIVNCIPMCDLWYGQGELLQQLWPLNRLMLPLSHLLTSDNGATGLLCIQTPLWLSAEGIALLAHSPVSVGINQPPDYYPQHAWGFGEAESPQDQRPWPAAAGGDGMLTLQGDDLCYEIFIAPDIVAAFHRALEVLGHPQSVPLRELFDRPTWTTWARYKDKIDQATVLNYAREIIDHGYPYHVLEIDDRWQVAYGDLSFDPRRFPDAPGMITTLHAQGFKVTAWVMPFLDPTSEAFAEAAAKGYLVRTLQDEPYLIPWWQGLGGLLDVSNPQALAWFLARLRVLQAQTGLDGFKFDAGEAVFLPPDARTMVPLARNDYSRLYVDWLAQHFSLVEARCGWLNQKAPLFFRVWDLSSHWRHANGLRAVIPSVLSLSLTGYPFVLPDMIGGNAYAGRDADAELMIRWTQLNALLPAMQFSLPPWGYGDLCDVLCRRYAQLHLEFVPTLLRLAEESLRSGDPIIRPLFWLAPHDVRALNCDDQYLVGDDILVAPVVHAGQRSRDIYLPPGQWRDYASAQIFSGPTVLRAYPAPLESLPLFLREV